METYGFILLPTIVKQPGSNFTKISCYALKVKSTGFLWNLFWQRKSAFVSGCSWFAELSLRCLLQYQRMGFSLDVFSINFRISLLFYIFNVSWMFGSWKRDKCKSPLQKNGKWLQWEQKNDASWLRKCPWWMLGNIISDSHWVLIKISQSKVVTSACEWWLPYPWCSGVHYLSLVKKMRATIWRFCGLDWTWPRAQSRGYVPLLGLHFWSARTWELRGTERNRPFQMLPDPLSGPCAHYGHSYTVDFRWLRWASGRCRGVSPMNIYPIVGTSLCSPLFHLEIHLPVVIAVCAQGHCLRTASPVLVKCS